MVALVCSMGHVCDLTARLADDGTLTFAPGQVCLFELDSPEAAGRIESRLQSGHGLVTAGTLVLDMAWQLSGPRRQCLRNRYGRTMLCRSREAV